MNLVSRYLHGVIGARPGSRASRFRIAFNNANNGSIGTSNHQEESSHDDEDAPTDHEYPPGRPATFLALAPVVIQPHTTHWLEAHGGAEEGTHERNQVTEDGNGACNDISEDGGADGATEPDCPMGQGVGC